jgi:hypothetical protein
VAACGTDGRGRKAGGKKAFARKTEKVVLES